MASQILQAGPAAETVRNVATGHIGDGFGPYAYAQHVQPPVPRGPRGPQRMARARVGTAGASSVSERYSNIPPPAGPRRTGTLRMPSTNAVPAAVVAPTVIQQEQFKERPSTEETAVEPAQSRLPSQQQAFLSEKDPEWDAIPEDASTIFSLRGWINAIVLVTILLGIVLLFAVYPIISRFLNPPPNLRSYGTGQLGDLNNHIPAIPAPTQPDNST